MTGITRDEPMFNDDQIRELAQSVEAHDFERIAPPATVWNNILAEVEVETASSEADARRTAGESTTGGRVAGGRIAGGRRDGRTRRWFQSSSTSLLAIAAATLLMVGVVAAVVARNNDAPLEELATATMTDADLPVPTSETAQARVVCDNDVCSVEVDLTGLPDAGADADLELWVINSDVSDMYTLGLVTGETGTFELPFGVTAEDYPIVDISIEPRDGVEAHSGQSVLRGVFTSA